MVKNLEREVSMTEPAKKKAAYEDLYKYRKI